VFVLLKYAVTILKRPEQPEQNERAEVAGKRIIKGDNGRTDVYYGKRPYNALGYVYYDSESVYTHYIVAFKCPDGAIKELRVNSEKMYDSLREGDTGILTYKERGSIEKKIESENLCYKDRLFIGFEKSF